jgi:hypothetical protein
MQTLFGRAVFDSGGRTYRWEDVLAAAFVRGDWESLETAVREGLACAKWAEAAGELPDEETVDAAADEFRYARNLLTSEEIETWLADWGLNVDDWLASVQRSLLREREEGRLEEITSEHEVDDEEIAEALYCDALYAGFLTRWADALAERAAAAAAQAAGAAASESESESESANEDEGEDEDACVTIEDVEACPGLAEHVSEATLQSLASLERGFEHYCEGVVTPEAIADQVTLHRLDWIHFDCLSATFGGTDMAREAVLCVRSDGQALSDVAALAGVEAKEDSFFLEDVEADWRSTLLGATEGDVVGPLIANDESTVFVIRGKSLPAADEADIQERAEQAALRSALERELRKYVSWRGRP